MSFMPRARHALQSCLYQTETLLSSSWLRFARQRPPWGAGFTSGVLGLESEGAARSLRGKTFCVTGSTDGIGLHTAYLLAQSGATVLLHGRSLHKVKQLIRAIRTDTKNQHVYGYCYDLSSLKAVRQFAAHLQRDAAQHFDGELHCLINNAGVFMEEKKETVDGLEMTWAVNVAAPFLLTAELLDLILRANGRILNVSSISLAHVIDFDNTQQENEPYQRMGHGAYGASKLALNTWSFWLAEQLRGHVTVNCVDPGTVHTKLLFTGWGDVSYAAMRTDEADDEYWAATDPALDAVTGQYFVNRKAKLSMSSSYDKSTQQRLWQLLEKQTGAVWMLPASRQN